MSDNVIPVRFGEASADETLGDAAGQFEDVLIVGYRKDGGMQMLASGAMTCERIAMLLMLGQNMLVEAVLCDD